MLKSVGDEYGNDNNNNAENAIPTKKKKKKIFIKIFHDIFLSILQRYGLS